MNPLKVKLVDEKPTHYVMHDGQSSFKVSKAGLAPETHAKIKALGAPVQKHEDGGKISPAEYINSDVGPANVDFSPGTNVIPPPGTKGPVVVSPGPGFVGTDEERGAVNRERISAESSKQEGLAKDAERRIYGDFAERGPSGYANNAKQRAAADDLGVQRKENKSEPVNEEKKTEPLPVATPQLGLLGAPKITRDTSEEEGLGRTAAELQENANQKLAQVAQAKAMADQVAANAKQDVMQQHASEQLRQHQEIQAQTSEQMRKVQQTIEDNSKIDTTVDPDRYWATRSTGGKIAAILGLAMGAAGTGRDGVNRAAAMLQQTIDRDVDAQKASAELRMRKGSQALEGQKNMYQLMRENGLDAMAATEATKANAMAMVQAKLDSAIAGTGSDAAKAQLSQMRADTANKLALNLKSAHDSQFETNKANQTAQIQTNEQNTQRQIANIKTQGTGTSPAASTVKSLNEYADELWDPKKGFLDRLIGMRTAEQKKELLAGQLISDAKGRMSKENVEYMASKIPGGFLEEFKAGLGMTGQQHEQIKNLRKYAVDIANKPARGVSREEPE